MHGPPLSVRICAFTCSTEQDQFSVCLRLSFPASSNNRQAGKHALRMTPSTGKHSGCSTHSEDVGHRKEPADQSYSQQTSDFMHRRRQQSSKTHQVARVHRRAWMRHQRRRSTATRPAQEACVTRPARSSVVRHELRSARPKNLPTCK